MEKKRASFVLGAARIAFAWVSISITGLLAPAGLPSAAERETSRVGDGKIESESIDPSILIAGETTHAAGLQLIDARAGDIPPDLWIWLPAKVPGAIKLQVMSFDGHYVGVFTFPAKSSTKSGWEKVSLPVSADSEIRDARNKVLRDYDPGQLAFSATGAESFAMFLVAAAKPTLANVATSLLVPSLASDRIYIQAINCAAAKADECDRRTTCDPVTGGQSKFFDTRCPLTLNAATDSPRTWRVTRIREGQVLKPAIEVTIE